MGIQPLQDWALIEPSEAKGKTTGGLFIPDTAKEKPVEGKVLAVGNGPQTGRSGPLREIRNDQSGSGR
jgi:chaperonin GroES